ncbi:hypothetical protein N0V92_012869 [Colletotrichum tropicale]|nr:hypothetical protein N0V92_012869 [Colletotrichum tropicale]
MKLFDTILLSLLELVDPDRDNLLELGTDEVAERGILARTAFKNAVSQSVAKIRELLGVGESAKNSHCLLPVLKVRVVHDIPQVLGDDRPQQTDVARDAILAGQVSRLHLVHQRLAAAVSDQECISPALLLQRDFGSLGEVTEHQSLSDGLLNRSIGVSEEVEGAIGLSSLVGRQVGQEVFAVALAIAPHVVVVLRLFLLLSDFFGLILLILGNSVGDLLLGETKIFDDALSGVLGSKSLHDKPIGLFLLAFGIFLPRLAKADNVTRLEGLLELLSCSTHSSVNSKL